jgi:hypothetical protein
MLIHLWVKIVNTLNIITKDKVIVRISVKPNIQPLYYQIVYFEDFYNIHILLE